MVAFLAFGTGYAFACANLHGQNAPALQQDPQSVPPQEQNSISFPAEFSESEINRNITIIFTVDEEKRIHILQINGGYNLLTEYIRKSLEGKVLESENAVPGINYVMTVKFPSTV
ncbi:MAG: hypothetical protein ACK4IY_02890 [Chitinophagales bacterium]